MRVIWKEDVRHWHPGQECIWEPGGFGVFDPGINPLSLIPDILPEPVVVSDADLHPGQPVDTDRSNDPLPARLRPRCRPDGRVRLAPDRQTVLGHRDRDDRRHDAAGSQKGQSQDRVDDELIDTGDIGEYDDIYRRFASLLASGESDADGQPLQLMSHCLTLRRRVGVDAFN